MKKNILYGLTAGLSVGLFLNGTAHAIKEDVMSQKATQKSPNMQPMIMHPGQEAAAQKKIEECIKKTGKRPNILLFLVDDVGWGDFGCYGGGESVGGATPTIDKLAREGLRLTSTYAQPTSSPTRATIMTGRLPVRNSVIRPPMYGEKGGLAGEVTIAQILKKAGYTTQAVGKWHIGENTESQPQNVGFDDFYGFLSVSDMYTEWRDEYFYPEIALSPERTALIKSLPFERGAVHTTSAENGGKYEKLYEIDIPRCSKLDGEWAKYSVDFIKKQKGSNKPFFLYHATRGAHFDNYPPAEFKGKSAAKHPYRDTIVEIDHRLKQLVAALEETSQLDNTIIFITSDNGPELESWPDCGWTPFTGAKGDTWEGGMRVPGIAYWKGTIKPGQESDGLFDLADLFTTFATIGGGEQYVPKDRYIDGIDQTSFLISDNGDSNRRVIHYWLQNYYCGCRVAEYKLMSAMFNHQTDGYSNPGGLSGNLQTEVVGRLFNLYMDPKESHSYLVRKLAYMPILQSESAKHLATFKTYPPKIPIKGGLL